jgi:hypothetical protein
MLQDLAEGLYDWQSDENHCGLDSQEGDEVYGV